MLGSKLFLVAPALSFLIGAAAPKANTATPACALAKEWVAANASELPRTYAAFKKYDHNYRAAIYVKLSTADRVTLWTEHLNEYITPSAGLSSEQQAFVRDVIARLPVFIDDDVADGAFKGSALTERANRLFGSTASSEMFFRLGRDPEASGNSATPDGNCTCTSEFGCGGSTECRWLGVTCDAHVCGWTGCYICSGQCKDIE